MAAWQEHLSEIYFDPKHPAAFAGPGKLHKVLTKEGFQVGVHRIRNWLQNKDSYSLQKAIRKPLRRNRVVTTGIDDLWDVDLADVSNLKSYNEDIHYLLIVIDVFSRYLRVVPLKDKKHNTIIDAFTSIFKNGSKPYKIRSDKGSEFKNRWVKAYFARNGVKHQFTQNETKANYAERVIRSLKSLMYRYFTYKQTYKYSDILQDLVYNYNHRPHRSLNARAPSDVNTNNEAAVWNELYIDTLKPKIVKPKKKSSRKKKPYKRYKFKKGDYVRITHIKHPFQRDYQEKWTEEIFIINERYYRQGIPVYKITDYAKDSIEGTFYQSELQKVNKDRDDLWRIDKVLKKRKKKGKEELFISFVGWPKKFNMWVSRDDIQNL